MTKENVLKGYNSAEQNEKAGKFEFVSSTFITDLAKVCKVFQFVY